LDYLYLAQCRGSLVTSTFFSETAHHLSLHLGYNLGQEDKSCTISAAHGYFGHLINSWADIMNRADLGMELMHERNAHNFPLDLA
jgi:hypothetical protein